MIKPEVQNNIFNFTEILLNFHYKIDVYFKRRIVKGNMEGECGLIYTINSVKDLKGFINIMNSDNDKIDYINYRPPVRSRVSGITLLNTSDLSEGNKLKFEDYLIRLTISKNDYEQTITSKKEEQ